MAYTFNKLSNGNIDVLENGKSIYGSGTTGVSASYAQQLGYNATAKAVNPPPPVNPSTGTQTGPTPPVVNPNPPISGPQPSQTQPSATQTAPTSAPPASSLQPGSSGTDVKSLQDWLVSQGYMTQAQENTGAGTYGPATTAAVSSLQKSLGMQLTTGQGSFGPQTQAAIAQKYQNLYNSQKGSTAPQDQSSAMSVIQQNTQQSQDPFFGAITSSMGPILQSLGQVLSNINNPALMGVSLQQEYNDLAAQNGLPAMQSNLLNMQRIMNGTEDDIRQEVASTGGFATESQVQGIAAARNKVLLKNYNTLATQYQAAQSNVQNMMQYASQDQATNLQKQSMSASVAESIAGIEQGMVQMGMTMQQHATDNLNKIVTNVGYTGLASQAQENPQMLSSYEQLLGLSQGALSNPESLQKLDTLRQQQVALGAQRVQIQMYNAGLSNGGASSAAPGNWVTQPNTGTQSLVARNTNGSDTQGRPYSLSSSQAQALLKNGATMDPGTQNMVVPGVGYYVAQPGGGYALSIDPTSSEGQFIQYRNRAENPAPWEPQGSLSNQRMTRNAMTRQTNAALSQYVDSTLYKNVSAAATYFAKLQAGLQNPGSIGDPDIIDSLVKINTGGQGAITDQQYQAYAQGQTWSDKFQVQQGKVVAKGGTLSPSQRDGIRLLAQDTFSNYRGEYETMYTQAMKNLDNQGIPDAFWGNMPDWTAILSGQAYAPTL